MIAVAVTPSLLARGGLLSVNSRLIQFDRELQPLNPKFIDTARRLERLSVTSPRWYRARLAFLVSFGYCYILLLLAVMLAVLAGVGFLVYAMLFSGRLSVGGIKLVLVIGIPALVIAWSILKSLWVRLEAPEGLVLDAQNAPELVRQVEQLRKDLKVGPIHRILLTRDYNAAVAQVPLLGILGWYRSYLIVGLPLMKALTKDQFVSVLAHEFGHLSANHSRFSGHVYRLRISWEKLTWTLHEQGRGKWLVAPFANRFVPYFDACSFALARGDEYVADRCAAECTSAKAAGEALVRIAVGGRFIGEEFWPSIERRIIDSETPPRAIIEELDRFLREDRDEEAVRSAIQKELKVDTTYDDTHPALKDRLAALERSTDESAIEGWVGMILGTSSARSAAEMLLGRAAGLLQSQLEKDWSEAAADAWQMKRGEQLAAREQLEMLSERPFDELDKEAQWQFIQATLEAEGEQPAIPLLRAFVSRHRAGYPNLLLGSILISGGDESGLEFLKTATRITPALGHQAIQSAAAYFKGAGETDKYREFFAACEQEHAAGAEEEAQREVLNKKTEFRTAVIDDKYRKLIIDQLRVQRAKKAWLAEKVVNVHPEEPYYVLVVERPTSLVELTPSEDLAAGFIQEFSGATRMPLDLFIAVVPSSYKWLRKKLLKVPGSELELG